MRTPSRQAPAGSRPPRPLQLSARESAREALPAVPLQPSRRDRSRVTNAAPRSLRSRRRTPGTHLLIAPSSAGRRGCRTPCTSSGRLAARRRPGERGCRNVRKNGRVPRPPKQRPRARSSSGLSQAVDLDGASKRANPIDLESARHVPPDAARRSPRARDHPTASNQVDPRRLDRGVMIGIAVPGAPRIVSQEDVR